MSKLIQAGLVTVLLSLLSREVQAWIPRLATWLVRRAANRLRDPDLRERYSEEWAAAVAEIPGPLVALMHALSLSFTAKDVERAAAAEVTADDVDERFVQLAQAVQRFGDAFAAACRSRGVTLEQLAAQANLDVRDLHSLQRGEFTKVRIGHLRIFAFLPDFDRVLGPDVNEMHRLYSEALSMYGGLGPSPVRAASKRQKLLCAAFGHEAYTHHIHRDGIAFHWVYRACERCGETSLMRSEPCNARKMRVRLDIDAPTVERYSCESRDFPGGSLDNAWRPRIAGLGGIAPPCATSAREPGGDC